MATSRIYMVPQETKEELCGLDSLAVHTQTQRQKERQAQVWGNRIKTYLLFRISSLGEKEANNYADLLFS